MIDLYGVRIENLRGYSNASLSLTGERVLLVGPNNSGKTSVLRLLDWAINRLDLERLTNNEPASIDDKKFLLPARDARHRARRMILRVRVRDGRSWDRFICDRSGVAELRLNLRRTPVPVVYAALGDPSRGERPTSDANAVELLRRLRKSVRFMHIPSFRDARSPRFAESFAGAIRRRVEERALHNAQGGAPNEYRRVSQAFNELKDVLLQLSQPLWDEVESRLPRGMTRHGQMTLACDLPEMIHFLESRLHLQVSTGEHDSGSVEMLEVGSGLQSLLDLAIQEAEIPQDRRVIMAVEEPEAFLHPSAQRTISNRLLKHRGIHQTIITTHSPIVVEEAQFGDVVLCRRQKFFEPAEVAHEVRSDINTALLSGFGAEMMFARSVMFVEGEGDRQFFDIIRRRFAIVDENGELDRCFVVPVGGKTRFAPWLRLLQAYGDAADRPINWLVVADGDAATEVRRALKHAGVTVQQTVLDALSPISEAHGRGDHADWRNAICGFNKATNDAGLSVHLLPLDLEESILGHAGGELVRDVAEAIGLDEHEPRENVLNALGSKGFGNGEGRKDPWIRGMIASKLAPCEISPSILHVMIRWMSGAMNVANANELLRAWEEAHVV